MLSIKEHHEIEYLEEVQQRYVDDLVKQKAQSRATNGKDGKAKGDPRA